MALRYITQPGVTPGKTPWFTDLVEAKAIVEGEIFEIKQVKESRKQSGYTITCDRFVHYLYKSSPSTEVLIDTLQDLCNTNPAFALYMVADFSNVESFNLAVDEEVIRLWTFQKKSNVLSVFTVAQMSSSPKSSKSLLKK